MEIAREICPGYTLTASEKPVIAEIFKWCMRLPGARLSPSKGLWIWGDIGTGKSTLIKIINRFCYEVRPYEPIGRRHTPLPFWMRIRRAIDLCDAYARDGVEGLANLIAIERLVIDDLGTENRLTSHYGTSTNVIGDLLLRRYDMRRDYQTYVTTNLSPPQIMDVYGPRIYDRCGEMFNFISLNGYSHRPELFSL